jgi:hypothetical protein
MHDEYKEYPIRNFARNLANLRKALKEQNERSSVDSRALAYDKKLYPQCDVTDSRGLPRWEGSDAERLLKFDIDRGEHNKMKRSELHLTRVAYQAFSLTVFRKHIHQEVRSRKERASWSVKKQANR